MSPPSQKFLKFLSDYCNDLNDKERMILLASELPAYDEWRDCKFPNMLEVFNEFKTCRPPAALFVAHALPLQPRFYSLSSSQQRYANELHLTVAIVKWNISSVGEC